MHVSSSGNEWKCMSIHFCIWYFIQTYMSTAVWILQIYKKINDVKSLLLSLYHKHVCTKLHHNVCHSLLPYRSRRLEQLLKLLPIWLVLHSNTYSLSLQNFLSHTLFHIQTRTKTEDNPLSNSLQYKSVSHIYICPFWYTNSGWPSPHMTSCLQMPSHMDSLSFPLTQHCTMHIYLTLHLTYSLPPQ